jgi:hypothetical protein
MTDEIPLETLEYINLGFKVDGAVPASGVEAAFLHHPTTGTVPRPTTGDWKPAELLEGEWRLFVGPDLTTGYYDVWARHTDNPEQTVRVARRAIRVI